jgi:hypothetical protein|tara:strand:- start:124 stop:330 length:207 start_codon:yes stop_codon:yes gene_type:complete
MENKNSKTDINGNCEHVHKDAPENSICEDCCEIGLCLCWLCGKSWNSEYHINDECVNINEDDERGCGR